MTKLLSAQQMYGVHEKVDRLMRIVKALLSRNNLIVLHNKATGEDEILDFNCNLCDRVGNCTIHQETYIIGDCHHLEYKEGWEEVS